MKYSFSPIHLLCIYALIKGTYYFIVLDFETAELGGLFPYILIGSIIPLIGFDILIQYAIRNRYWKIGVQSLVAVVVVIYYLKNGAI